MKAIIMPQPGPAEVLSLAEVDKPAISDAHQVLIRIEAAGVNPVDTKLRSRGTYYPDALPAILGCDGAGVVEAIGDKVCCLRPGDAVYFCHGGIGGEPGSYAQYKVLDEHLVVPKPTNLSFAEAAAAPLVLLTAWESLFDRARVEAGQTVLIHAGAGGVGHVAIQLAKAAGCQVITTVSSAEKTEFVKRLGADVVIDYRQENCAAACLEATGGQGVDMVLDTVGGKVFEASFQATRPYGQVVSLLQPAADCDWKTARNRNLSISLELMLSPQYFGWHDAEQHQSWILEQCRQRFETRELQIHLAHTLPLEQAAEAHRLIEQGGTQGKIALEILH